MNRATLDVRDLPPVVFDTRDVTWWGNFLLILIETTTTLILVTTYFYLAHNNEQWPPPQPHRMPTEMHPAPDLLYSTIIAVLLAASCIPMVMADKAARRNDNHRVYPLVAIMFGLGLTALVLQALDFRGFHFRWDEHAYGSVIWSLVGLHFTYILFGVLETGVLLLWIWMYGIDANRTADVTLMGVVWYWTTAIWMLMYVVVYWTPRWMS